MIGIFVLTSLFTSGLSEPDRTLAPTDTKPLDPKEDRAIRSAACISNNLNQCMTAPLNQDCPEWKGLLTVSHEDAASCVSAKIAFNQKDGVLALAFRGSKGIQDWMNNLDYKRDDPEDDPSIYPGFADKYERLAEGGDDLFNKFWGKVSDPEISPKEIWIIGDSLGASVAEIFALKHREQISKIKQMQPKLITFGKPMTFADLKSCDVDGLVRLRVVHYRQIKNKYYVDPVPYVHNKVDSKIGMVGKYSHCSDPILLNYDNGILVRSQDIAAKLKSAKRSPPIYFQVWKFWQIKTRGILHTIPSYYASLKNYKSTTMSKELEQLF